MVWSNWAWSLLIASLSVSVAASSDESGKLDCSQVPPPDPASLATDFLGPLWRATVGNHRIAYRRFTVEGSTADPTPLVLLMGYGGTMSAWGPELLHRLARGREVIIFDNVAQGLSEEIVPGTGAFTPEMMVEATLGFLDALNLTQPNMAGLSLGACAVLRLAAFHPERIGKVVSWGGTSPDGRAVVGALSTMKALFRPDNTDDDYARINFNTSTEEGLHGACRWIQGKQRMPADPCKPETNKRYSAGIARATRPWDWSSWRALGCTRTQVLLMGGMEDKVIPPYAQTKLAAQISGAWLAQFPRAGHGFLWQHMDQVVAVVEAFLQGGVAAAAPTPPPVAVAAHPAEVVSEAMAVAMEEAEADSDEVTDAGQQAAAKVEL